MNYAVCFFIHSKSPWLFICNPGDVSLISSDLPERRGISSRKKNSVDKAIKKIMNDESHLQFDFTSVNTFLLLKYECDDNFSAARI